nr:hypothetical protein [Tanacetum cinerariifolium]
MFAKEADKIKKYVRGLPDMIYGSVMALKPKTMQEAIEIATELMDKKVLTFAERERQTVISELPRIDHMRSTEITELRTALQGQVTALQGQ